LAGERPSSRPIASAKRSPAGRSSPRRTPGATSSRSRRRRRSKGPTRSASSGR